MVKERFRDLDHQQQQQQQLLQIEDSSGSTVAVVSPSGFARSRSRIVVSALRRGYHNGSYWFRALGLLTALGAVLTMWSSVQFVLDHVEPTDRRPPLGRPPRVAVCFFGLARSLRWTLPSVEKHLLDVLRDSDMQVEIFVHTYDLLEVCSCCSAVCCGW